MGIRLLTHPNKTVSHLLFTIYFLNKMNYRNKYKEVYAPLNAERNLRKQKKIVDTNISDANVNGSDVAEELQETNDSQSSELMPDDILVLNETEKPIRINLESSQSCIPLIDATYSIMTEVTSLLEYMSLKDNFLERDDTAPIFNGSTHTKGEWSREYYSICNKFVLPQAAQKEILNLVYNTFGELAELPIALTTSGKERLKRKFIDPNDEEDDREEDSEDNNSISAPNTMSKVSKYIRKASRWIKLHQCENSCCVFVGVLNTAFACPTCSARRYNACVRSDCKGKGTKDDCEHLHNDGVAKKFFLYRLLIPLLTDLINTKNFVTALHYHNDRIGADSENAYTDILDGEVAKEHLHGMDTNYKAWRSIESTADRENTVPVNLLLMDFYDGAQLFHWKTSDFWAFLTSIVNLPPSYRGKLGISTFLSAIYGGKHKTAERFLFTDLYCEELRALYEGFEYVGNTGQRFFIQARLIFHVMDTKALEPVLNMESMTTSRYGCPFCRNAHGQHNSWKVIYTGNRNTLPIFHYLRYFGQSGKCCPHGYYLPDGNYFTKEAFINDDEPITAESLSRKNDMKFCMPCDNDKTRYEHIKNFLLDKNASYTWHHLPGSGFDFKDVSRGDKGIRARVFYRHFDFRPQVTYRRITKVEHLEAAMEARVLNNERKTKEEIKVQGFKDVWPFERLPYSDLTRNSSPPPCHAISGMTRRCLQYMLGLFKEKKPSRRIYAKKKKSEDEGDAFDGDNDGVGGGEEDLPKYRPSYHNAHPPYSSSKKQAHKCRAWLLCVLIPTGMPDTKDWVLNLDQIGNFKINMWKNVVLVYWDLILTILNDIDEWYRLLFRMFADKILKLLSFRIEKDSVSQLQLEVNEMICLWEAFFPDDQNYFQLHQIMCLVSSIPLHGSMHAWSELFGEQALAKLKKIKTKTNPGGVSYETYIMDRQVNSELDTMSRFYSKAVNKDKTTAANYKTKVSFDVETKILSYSVMQFHIYDEEKKHISSGNLRDLNRHGIPEKDKNTKIMFRSTFNTEELNALVNLLLMEIRKRYRSESECNNNSCLYSSFSHKKDIASKDSNVKWLENIVLNDDLEEHALVHVAKSLLSLQPSFHSKAWIYGLQFRSRGSVYREYYEDRTPTITSYGAQNLYDAREDLSWQDKRNYSSWCMFKQSDLKLPSNKPWQSGLRYGKLNAFFEIHIGDNSIDGLLVASITSHKVRDSPCIVDVVERMTSLDPSIIFVALQDIYPTRIATVAIAANGKPNQIHYTVSEENAEYVNVRSTNMEMSHSYMLKMDADKISRFPKFRPWTLYSSSSVKSRISSSSTETNVNLPNESDDFNDNGMVMQPRESSSTSNSIHTWKPKGQAVAEDNSNKQTSWKPKSTASKADSHSFSDLKIKSGFGMPFLNSSSVAEDIFSSELKLSCGILSSSAVADNTHLHALVQQGTESHSSNEQSTAVVLSSGQLSSLTDVELTEEDTKELLVLLSEPVDNTLVIEKFGIDMTLSKISCLRPGEWLNDEVINFYVQMMMQEGRRGIYSFSTFFMDKLYVNGIYSFETVARWTKKVDIFRQNKVFIPINDNNLHWVLVYIDLTAKTIFFYDGFKKDGDTSYDRPFLSLTLQVLLYSITYFEFILTLSSRSGWRMKRRQRKYHLIVSSGN